MYAIIVALSEKHQIVEWIVCGEVQWEYLLGQHEESFCI